MRRGVSRLIDKSVVEAMIIFAYKQEEFALVEELLKVLQKYQGLSFHVESRQPQLKLLQCMTMDPPKEGDRNDENSD